MVVERTGVADAVRRSSACRTGAACSSGPAIKVYEGMIVGEHCKDRDIGVNACREKKLTNIRGRRRAPTRT